MAWSVHNMSVTQDSVECSQQYCPEPPTEDVPGRVVTQRNQWCFGVIAVIKFGDFMNRLRELSRSPRHVNLFISPRLRAAVEAEAARHSARAKRCGQARARERD